MSELSNIYKETGPGSYEIQDSIGYHSHKYHNSPRAVIARAKKTDKLFMSPELNKQLSGLESPGVNTYSPNHQKLLEKSPSAIFGTSERTMSYITPLLDRSPGPMYISSQISQKPGVSFAKARRKSNVDQCSPAPWDYNPIFPTSKVPSVIFKGTLDKLIEQKTLTPGPGSYNMPSPKKVPGAYVSKIGRHIIENRNISPGPGTYEPATIKLTNNSRFGSGKRNTDPRKCNDYLDANAYEYFRDF